jgi:HNH endonuclease
MKTECWLWTGHVRPNDGYGQATTDCALEGTRLAHRIAWKLAHPNARIPHGWQVRHRCHVRLCVRHLTIGSYAANMADMEKAGHRRGRSHLFSSEQAAAIRTRYATGTTSLAKLGREYGCSDTAIHHLVHRKERRR